ncbi:response regulator [Geotalea uraniireducens]|uniref:Response regulator receiver protein n=1 Tax=Geotalea uraniireducens (strain Rf4) TaxID=351605 RepID=A5GA60_GEOUR|nr:response regulator [Geotalea uraniireducens]ABQ25527.1 response regulator receiver protein [Geotalea uraniireducens Rf4]
MEDGGILLVDDDIITLNLLSECFRQSGMRVHCAENGEDALQMMQESTFVLMLTDLQMPGMNGLELARKARELAPDLHIVMCTGALTREVCELARKAGIAKVLRKPYVFLEILAIARGDIKSG